VFTHILVPLDESPYSERALSYATDLAKQGGGEVSLLVVVHEPPHPAGVSESDPVSRRQEERPARAERYLEQKAEQLRSAGVSVDTELRFGDAANSIIDAATEKGADLIAMSTHGLGASGRYALGSVALKVLMAAPCPVFMVRIQGAWKGPEL
jgi:nucleotide-binding universal stress UspA family protein